MVLLLLLVLLLLSVLRARIRISVVHQVSFSCDRVWWGSNEGEERALNWPGLFYPSLPWVNLVNLMISQPLALVIWVRERSCSYFAMTKQCAEWSAEPVYFLKLRVSEWNKLCISLVGGLLHTAIREAVAVTNIS